MALNRIAATPQDGWVGTGTYVRAVIDGHLVDVETVEPAYAAARRAAYPSLGDQLDAAFKARMGDGSELAAIDGAIAAVKAAHPKPVR